MSEELEAGRELNERIMREVLGWHHEPHTPATRPGHWVAPDGSRIVAGKTPDFSRDLAAAWQMLETTRLEPKRWYWRFDDYNEDTNAIQGGGPRAWLVDVESEWARGRVRNRSLPLAICQAALALLADQALMFGRAEGQTGNG